MSRQRPTRSVPAPARPRTRLNPVSLVVLLLCTGGAWNIALGAVEPPAEVEFGEDFLFRPGGAPLDLSRFARGNAVLPGVYRSDLRVNGVWAGRMEIQMRAPTAGAEPVPCMSRALLERIGVNVAALAPDAAGRLAGGCAALGDLIPDATAVFDSADLRLDIGVPQAALRRAAQGYVDPADWDDGVTAARLQYNANAYYTSSGGRDALQGYAGLDAGLNIGAWRLRHLGNVEAGGAAGTRYQAVQTSARRGIVSLDSQFVIGDAFTDGALFDSYGFRGAQLASDDRMLPPSQRGYAPTVRGIARSNARVQVRQNGNVIHDSTVAAGAFEIDDLYPTGYGGDLEVIVTEADGSVRVSRVPFAPTVNALRPGQTRYAVTAGQYRANGQPRPLLAQATLQRGFTNLLTGYGGVQAAQRYLSALAGVALNTGYGAFGADLTQANARLDSGTSRGYSMRLSYSKLVSPTGTNLWVAAYRYSTGGYLSLPDAMARQGIEDRGNAAYASTYGTPYGNRSGDPFTASATPTPAVMPGGQRGRLQATVRQTLPSGWGDLYLTGSTVDYWNRDGRDTQLQAGYNNRYGNLNIGVTAAREFNVGNGRWENRVMLTIGIPLGRQPSAPYSTTSLQAGGGSTALQQSVTGTLGEERLLGYGVNATATTGAGSRNAGLGGNASYLAPAATLLASAAAGRGYSQASAGISGGVVAYAGGVAFSPSLGDTVGIVEAADASGARVVNGNGLRVDGRGHAVVSNLMPYLRNEVELDPKGLPLNIALQSTLHTVAPTAGAVVVLPFATQNAGRAAILDAERAGGKPLPFGADVLDGAGQSVGTVAQGGRIVAYGLPSDQGELLVKWGSGKSDACRLSYALPPAGQSGTPVITAGASQCL